MFGNENDAENVFEFLHCRHKNIKFAIEKENNKIAYHVLDIFLMLQKRN